MSSRNKFNKISGKDIADMLEQGISYKMFNISKEDKKLDRELQRNFGISLSEYLRILDEQNGVCFICLGVDKDKRLAVDHDHSNGKVRGLLCHKCNWGLGLFRDNINSLNRAVEYLNQSYI